jgi:hypothetical protein
MKRFTPVGCLVRGILLVVVLAASGIAFPHNILLAWIAVFVSAAIVEKYVLEGRV